MAYPAALTFKLTQKIEQILSKYTIIVVYFPINKPDYYLKNTGYIQLFTV